MDVVPSATGTPSSLELILSATLVNPLFDLPKEGMNRLHTNKGRIMAGSPPTTCVQGAKPCAIIILFRFPTGAADLETLELLRF